MTRNLFSAWGFALGASLSFAIMFALPRISGAELGWAQIIFFRYCGGFLVILAVATAQGRLCQSLRSRYWFVHAPRAVFGVGTVGCIVVATQYLPYADTMAVSFSKGGFVLLLSMVLLGECVGAIRFAALMMSFCGAIVVLSAQHSGVTLAFLSGAGGIALLGAVFMAAEVVLLKLATIKDGVLPMLLWVNGVGMVLSGALAFATWQPLEMQGTGWVLLMGPVAVFGQMLNYFSHKRADASFLAPLGYATIVYSVIIGWLVFGESLTWITMAGILLILAGGVLSARTPLDTLGESQRSWLRPIRGKSQGRQVVQQGPDAGDTHR